MKHWESGELRGTLLPETDYDTGKPIALLWPCREPETGAFIELYYNERLVKYPVSFLGHTAINVNGEIFNYSHLVNECEVMDEARYFYRPALGKYAPSPGGGYSIEDPERPFLDKFGRQFMRTIHVARVTGHDTGPLQAALRAELEKIHHTPEDPRRPGKYRDFRLLTRSCTTIIRDALRQSGFPRIRGVFPREMYTSAVWSFREQEKKGGLKLSVYKRPQLFVDEAPASAITPLVNPLNILRRAWLRQQGIIL